jgi:exodeoxyribonuclease III
VAHNEIDLKNPKTNTKSAGFTKEERECFTNLLSDGYFDSFRALYPDLTDAYTWWSYMRNARAKNVGWRIDYFVMSNKLRDNLVDNCIRAKVTGSDHCPVALFLTI